MVMHLLLRPRALLLLLYYSQARVQGSEFRDQGLGCTCWPSSGSRVQGSGSRVQGPGSRVQGSGFRVQGSGFRVYGSGCRVHGFRIQGPGFGFVFSVLGRTCWRRSGFQEMALEMVCVETKDNQRAWLLYSVH